MSAVIAKEQRFFDVCVNSFENSSTTATTPENERRCEIDSCEVYPKTVVYCLLLLYHATTADSVRLVLNKFTVRISAAHYA